jgi:hypothetical protein
MIKLTTQNSKLKTWQGEDEDDENFSWPAAPHFSCHCIDTITLLAYQT